MNLLHPITRSRHNADVAGAWVSGLCVCHCVAVPVLAAFSGLVIPWLADERVEHALLASSVVLACLSIGHGTIARHRSLAPMCFVLAGMFCLLIVRAWLPEGSLAEGAAALLGGALVIEAHRRNRRLIQTCACCTAGATVAVHD